VEDKKQYRVEVSNNFEDLEDLDAVVQTKSLGYYYREYTIFFKD
jgi:hypothetical protein